MTQSPFIWRLFYKDIKVLQLVKETLDPLLFHRKCQHKFQRLLHPGFQLLLRPKALGINVNTEYTELNYVFSVFRLRCPLVFKIFWVCRSSRNFYYFIIMG